MPEPTDAALAEAYRRELLEDRIPRGTRTLALAYFAIVVGYMVVDSYVYPEQYARFLAARLVTNAIFAWIAFRGAWTRPVFSEHLLFLAGGAMLLFMVYEAGAAQSFYYPAFMVLFFGAGIFLPMSGARMAGLCGVVTAAFAPYPLVVTGPVDGRLYLTQLSFLAVAAALSVVAARFQGRLRFADFRKRLHLASARDELAATNDELGRTLDELRHTQEKLVRGERLAAAGQLSGSVAEEIGRPLELAGDAARLLRTRAQELLVAKEGPEREALETEVAELVGLIEQGFRRSERMVRELRALADRAQGEASSG